MSENQQLESANADETSEKDYQEVVKPDIMEKAGGNKGTLAAMMESVQMAMLQRSNHNSLDVSKFSEKQLDSVLDTVKQNEEHTFQYQIKKLEKESELKKQVIEASVIDQKTYRFVILGVLSIVFITTMVIIIFAREFFERWLYFLTGILGGFGISKISSFNDSKQKLLSVGKDSDDND